MEEQKENSKTESDVLNNRPIEITIGDTVCKFSEPCRRVSRELLADVAELQNKHNLESFETLGDMDSVPIEVLPRVLKAINAISDFVGYTLFDEGDKVDCDIHDVMDNATEEEIMIAFTQIVEVLNAPFLDVNKQPKPKANATPKRRARKPKRKR